VKTYYECVPCLMRQTLEAARQATADETIQEQVLRRVMLALSEADLGQSTPVWIGMVHRLVREATGNNDPYREEKEKLNQVALDLYPRFKSIARSSADPVETGLRLACAGNVIDFVVAPSVERSKIDDAVDQAMSSEISEGVVNEFKDLVRQARRILYLGDNAGEIVFDKLLIELLPREKITYAVKGRPVVNDVTIDDARTVGITDVVEVIDNGSDLPGTVLSECSDSFRDRFWEADLIISKGQGNYESLSETDKEIFFLFKAKCEVMTLHLGREVGSLVFMRR
jgi:uncharacterized protein with ATP-grasp and redox domains